MTASLDRFLSAQAPVYQAVLAELRDGHKQSHWMWFIFPQLADLGRSPMAKFYGLEEARAYLRHEVLGPRLLECTGLVNAVTGRSAHEIFGSPDDLKFRSCATLFRLAGGGAAFEAALAKYYGGVEDEMTVRLVGRD